ncbi:hypothetical protein BC628DRAFT_108458 [Trametes gibbosa]|nr:hypothetical protein BC628DRAFT_108458 [Trametes gibbosa]
MKYKSLTSSHRDLDVDRGELDATPLPPPASSTILRSPAAAQLPLRSYLLRMLRKAPS